MARSVNCLDQNECSSGDICGNPKDGNRCKNTDGGYECYCDDGYEPLCADKNNCKNGCKNINECEKAPPCGTNATCTDTPGSFICKCNPNNEGDPYDKKKGCKCKLNRKI